MSKSVLHLVAQWLRVAADVLDILAEWLGKDDDEEKDNVIL
jgi:hypothetical protein